MPDPVPAASTEAALGRLAVEHGFVSQAQLDQVLRLHAHLGGTHPLGSLFVQRGLMTLSQVQDLLRLQKQLEVQKKAAAASGPPPGRPTPPGATPAGGALAGRPGAPGSNPFLIADPPAGAPPAPISPGQGVRGPSGASPARPKVMGGGPATAADQPGGAGPGGTLVARPGAGGQGQGGGVSPGGPAPRPATAGYAPGVVNSVKRAPPPSASALDIGPARPGTIIPAMLDAAEKRGASDVHIHAGSPPAIRVEGTLLVLDQLPIEIRTQERELLGILTPDQRLSFGESGDLDFAMVLPSELRIRANVYRSHTGVDAVFRLIPRAPQTLEELGLPAAIEKLISYHQGLVLVTGPAGSGKSTTLAALINILNQDRAEHILTLEDPIEQVHSPKKALVNQRQVGRDTESFARALRGALREDPDIIMIGDLRDRETISLAITAAETGHLVIGSMNTNNAARTVGRLIDAFPPDQQGQVRAMLSESLRGVVSQRLLPGLEGRRQPAVELLICTPAIGNLVREGKLVQIRSQMQTGKSIGMRTLDEALKDLVLASKVDGDEARKHAENPMLIPGGAPPPPVPAALGATAAVAPGRAPPPGGPGRAPPAPPARPGIGMPRPGGKF